MIQFIKNITFDIYIYIYIKTIIREGRLFTNKSKSISLKRREGVLLNSYSLLGGAYV